MFYVLLVVYVLVTLVMVGFILLRKGEGGGLSGAFAGIGGEATFGVKAAKQLDKLITYLAIFFLGLGLLLNLPRIRGGEEEAAAASEESPEGEGE